MNDRHDEFNQWLRDAYPSTWPDWSDDAIMLARAAFDAQPRPRSMESAPKDGTWFEVRLACRRAGGNRWENASRVNITDKLILGWLPTTTDEQVGE